MPLGDWGTWVGAIASFVVAAAALLIAWDGRLAEQRRRDEDVRREREAVTVALKEAHRAISAVRYAEGDLIPVARALMLLEIANSATEQALRHRIADPVLFEVALSLQQAALLVTRLLEPFAEVGSLASEQVSQHFQPLASDLDKAQRILWPEIALALNAPVGSLRAEDG